MVNISPEIHTVYASIQRVFCRVVCQNAGAPSSSFGRWNICSKGIEGLTKFGLNCDQMNN